MHIRQLTYFYQVAEFGNISAAAAFLNIAQPAISRQLLQLESELGAILIVRHGRGIALTEAGRCLLEHTKVILRETEELRRDISRLASNSGGEVTIGVPAMVGPIFAPTLLSRLKASHPQIRLHVLQGMSEEIRKALVTRSIDIGIFFCNKPSAIFVSEELDKEDLYLIGMPGNRHIGDEHTNFAILADVPLVLPPRGHEMRILIDEAAERLNLTLNVVFELDALGVIKEIIKRDGLCTILPILAAWPEIRDQQLACSHLRFPSIARPLVLATLPTGLSTAARTVARTARQEFQALRRMGTWSGPGEAGNDAGLETADVAE